MVLFCVGGDVESLVGAASSSETTHSGSIFSFKMGSEVLRGDGSCRRSFAGACDSVPFISVHKDIMVQFSAGVMDSL